MAAAIIVAAGSSRRMGFDKLMAPLAGAPVLQHTANAFIRCAEIDELILVCPQSRFEQLELISNGTRIERVDGGIDRHDSVSNGLAALRNQPALVAVHDGARPLIAESQIKLTLVAAHQHGAAASARRVTETVKRATADQFVSEPVDRQDLWLMETPQVFQYPLLTKAYAAVHSNKARVTDEVSALELIGVPTYLVANPTPNLKITYPEDLSFAEIFLNTVR